MSGIETFAKHVKAFDTPCKHGIYTNRVCEICHEIADLTRQLAEVTKERDALQALLTENQHMHSVESASMALLLERAEAERNALRADAEWARLAKELLNEPNLKPLVLDFKKMVEGNLERLNAIDAAKETK